MPNRCIQAKKECYKTYPMMSNENSVQSLPCEIHHHVASFLCPFGLISYSQTCHIIRSSLDIGVVRRALSRPVSCRSISIPSQQPEKPKLWTKLDLIPIVLSSSAEGMFLHSITCLIQFSFATTFARVWIQDSDSNVRASNLIQKHATESWIWTVELSFQPNEDEMNYKGNAYSLWYQGIDCKRGYSLYAKDIQCRAIILDGAKMAHVYNSFAFFPSSILLEISSSNHDQYNAHVDSLGIIEGAGNGNLEYWSRCRHVKNALLSYKFGCHGFNLLHYTCLKTDILSLSNEMFHRIKLIVEWGGKEVAMQENDFGETSLHIAVQKRLIRVVKLLIQTCGEECLTICNNEGKTPLETIVQGRLKKDSSTGAILHLFLNVMRDPDSENQNHEVNDKIDC